MGGRPERFINSLSFQYLTQSIELDLSNIHGRGMFPSKKEINSFIMEEMGIGPGVLRGVQHHPRFPKVHLQFLKDEDMQVAELKVKDGLVMQCKKLKIYGYRCDQPMVTIVLNGQDMDIEDGEIKRVLEKYGTVVTCERGKNIDLSTSDHFVTDGTWTIRMTPKLRVQTPETIYYFGPSGAIQTWVLNYDGVGSSCILCGIQGHMGFRCNSLIPRGGRLGKQPAGVGFWTDVVKCLKPAVQQPVVQGQGPPAAQPGAPPGVAPEGLAGTPALPVAAAPLNERNNLYTNLARQQGAGYSASQPVWGTGVIRADPKASVTPAVPGMQGQESKWQRKKLKNQKRNEKRKEKRKVLETGVATHNPFDVLKDNEDGEEWETEDELDEKAQPRVLRVGRMTSVLAAYGARKSLPLANWFKKTANRTIERPPNSKKVDKNKKKEDSKKRRGSINVNGNEKKTRTSSNDDVPVEENEDNDRGKDKLTEESVNPDENIAEMETGNKEDDIVEEREVVEDLPVLDDVLPGDIGEEADKAGDLEDKVSEDDTVPSLSPPVASPSSLPASAESVNLLGGHSDAGSTQYTQDNGAEYGQSGAVSEQSLPSSVPSENLLIPTQSTQGNRGGYAQSLGVSEPSSTYGAGESEVNTGTTFDGSQSQSNQPISEEELEIKQKAEMIRSQLESSENKEMSSSLKSHNGL